MNSKRKTIKNIENETKKVIRVSLKTDKLIQEKLLKMNSNREEFGKVSKEKLIHFLVENMTPEQGDLIQSSTLTWDIEEKRPALVETSNQTPRIESKNKKKNLRSQEFCKKFGRHNCA